MHWILAVERSLTAIVGFQTIILQAQYSLPWRQKQKWRVFTYGSYILDV